MAFSDYAYNDRNELTGSERRQGTPQNPGALVPGQSNGYAYDPIGNRDSAWIDAQPPTTYTPNELNQYASTSQPAEEFEYDHNVLRRNDGNLTRDGTTVGDESSPVPNQQFIFDYDPILDPPRAALRPERASRTSLAASRQGQVGNRQSYQGDGIKSFRDAYQATDDEKARRALVIKAIDQGLVHAWMSRNDLTELFGDEPLVYRLEPEYTVVARGYVWFDPRKQKTLLAEPTARGAPFPAEGWHITFDLLPCQGDLAVWSYELTDNPEVSPGTPWPPF